MIIIWAAVVWVGVIWAYIAVMHAKAVNERQGLSLFWKVHILPLAILGVLLDAAFNLTFGTVMFRELPHELLFSSRVQRHIRDGGRHFMLAVFWARQLNTFDPDHIKT